MDKEHFPALSASQVRTQPTTATWGTFRHTKRIMRDVTVFIQVFESYERNCDIYYIRFVFNKSNSNSRTAPCPCGFLAETYLSCGVKNHTHETPRFYQSDYDLRIVDPRLPYHRLHL